jgi:hypothetical protein
MGLLHCLFSKVKKKVEAQVITPEEVSRLEPILKELLAEQKKTNYLLRESRKDGTETTILTVGLTFLAIAVPTYLTSLTVPNVRMLAYAYGIGGIGAIALLLLYQRKRRSDNEKK